MRNKSLLPTAFFASPTIVQMLDKRLRATFRDLFKHAMFHILGDKNALQIIINLQIAVELLGKSYILNNSPMSWQNIILQKSYQNKTEAELIKLINDNKIHTVGYVDVIKFLSNNLGLYQNIIALLEEFQTHRNQIVHLGIIKEPLNITDDALLLVIELFSQFEIIFHINEDMKNNPFELLIGAESFSQLIHNTNYVEKAIQKAENDIAYFCISCHHPTLIYNNCDAFHCICCGMIIASDSIAYLNCPICKSNNSVAYDALNIERNFSIKYDCLNCAYDLEIFSCPKCKNISVSPAGESLICSFCKYDLYGNEYMA